jgi:hypothetical protein
MMKSRRIRWAGHVARIEEEKKDTNMHRLLMGKPKERAPRETKT